MKIKNILLATVALLSAPVAASAQEALSVSGNVALTTDYVWRGVSQSDGGFALSGGLDAGTDLVYFGTWLSNVDFNTEAELEWDIYAGVKPTLGPVTFDFGVLAYLYPQESNLNTFEGKAAATIAAESGLSATLALYYSPDVSGSGASSVYTELGFSAPIPGATVGPFSLSVGGAVGSYSYDHSFTDYNNWRLALTAATESGWAIEAAYTDTDYDGGDIYEGRGILTLKRTF
jgi:uncharacterized protein (TIGR02001 family)